jgi:hypothetical protein
MKGAARGVVTVENPPDGMSGLLGEIEAAIGPAGKRHLKLMDKESLHEGRPFAGQQFNSRWLAQTVARGYYVG